MSQPELPDNLADLDEYRQRFGVKSERPHIVVRGRFGDDVVEDIVGHLLAVNTPPVMFRHGTAVSRYVPHVADTGGALQPVDRIRLMDYIERTMRPVRIVKGDEKPDRVDGVYLDMALLRLLDALPPISSVTMSPFLRHDGTVCDVAGYDPTTCMYLTDATGVVVPDMPTRAQIAEAVELIDEMLADFPVAGPSDRAHIYTLLLTPLIRHLVRLVPLFVIDANGPGVGKNLLSECCMYVTTGHWVQTNQLPTDNEEQRKQITAIMRTGPSVALFDEAHIVTGLALARLITSTTWGDRLLGYSEQVTYPNVVTLVSLGNNVQIQGDMPRRSVVVRLESQVADPHLRTGFRHGDLKAWVEEHRPALLTALLTLLRAWVVEGRPQGTQPLGSFDGWAALIGGVLDVAGVEGFLGNVAEMRARSATDDMEMQAHIAELAMHVGVGSPFGVKKVCQLIEDDVIEVWPPRVGSERERMRQAVGMSYRRYAGRWLGDYKLEPDGATAGSRRWVITSQSGGTNTGSGESSW